MQAAHDLAAKLKKQIATSGIPSTVGEWAKKGIASVKKGANAATSAVSSTAHSAKTYEDPSGRRFRVKRLLSDAGRFGEVFLAEEHSEGAIDHLFAVKVVPLSNDNKRAIQREAQLWKLLSGHQNIVKLESAFNLVHKDRRDAIFVMELCDGGSLLDVANERLSDPMPEREVLGIFMQVCQAVGHMHSCEPPVAHRDIKLENVLRGANAWKLCDFGSATAVVSLATNEIERQKVAADVERNTTMCYRAPEMVDLFRKQLICEKVDIWALGCLLYKMAFFKDAYEEGALQILNNRITFPKFTKYTPEFINLIRYILVPDPQERPHIGMVAGAVAAMLGVANPLKAFEPYDHQRHRTAAAQDPTPDELPTRETTTTPPPPQHKSLRHHEVAGQQQQQQQCQQQQPKDLFSMLEWTSEPEVPQQQPQHTKSCSPNSDGTPPPLRHVGQQQPPPQTEEDFFADFDGNTTGPAPASSAPLPRPPSRGPTEKTNAPTVHVAPPSTSLFDDGDWLSSALQQPQQPFTAALPPQQLAPTTQKPTATVSPALASLLDWSEPQQEAHEATKEGEEAAQDEEEEDQQEGEDDEEAEVEEEEEEAQTEQQPVKALTPPVKALTPPVKAVSPSVSPKPGAVQPKSATSTPGQSATTKQQLRQSGNKPLPVTVNASAAPALEASLISWAQP